MERLVQSVLLKTGQRVLRRFRLLDKADLSVTLSGNLSRSVAAAMCSARSENVMPRRKSLLAQMYEARQKAKLQQQKLEEQAARAWAAEERRVAAQMEKEATQQRREAKPRPRPGSGRSSRPSVPGSRRPRR